MASLFSDLVSEGLELDTLFKNALCFTLAYTTVQSMIATEQDIVIVGIGVVIGIFFLVLLKNQLQYLQKEHANSISQGPLAALLFLCDLSVNTFVQFISTLMAQWVTTFPASVENPVKDILPIVLISITLFWSLLYSVGLASIPIKED